MRVIPTKMAEPGMRLGRSVFDARGNLLLAAGITLRQRYIELLYEQGYTAMYIADEMGDVELPEPVCMRTRQEVLNTAMDVMKKGGWAASALEPDTSNTQGNPLARETVSTARQRQEVTHRVTRAVELLINEITSQREVMIGLVDIKSLHDYTFSHSVQVAVTCIILGRLLGYTQAELSQIGVGALLHDIGKAAIPEKLWSKQDPPTPEEFEEMKTHARAGFDLLRSTRLSLLSAHMAFQHHERWDGSGYPRGLRGEDISKYSRLCGVCDVFDAMTSDRPYKRAQHPREALAFLDQQAGVLFDTTMVAALRRVAAPYPVATSVLLSTGETAVVKKLNYEALDRPVVVVTRDQQRKFYSDLREVDLLTTTDLSIEDYAHWFHPRDRGQS